jgi:hypothetical protein
MGSKPLDVDVVSHEEFVLGAVIENESTNDAQESKNHTLSEEQLNAVIDKNLTNVQRQQLKTLLRKFSSSFDAQALHLGQAKHVTHTIETGDHRPLRQRPYRVSPKERTIIQEQVNDMRAKGVIEDSCSPWASPVVLVKKKDDTWRFCIDFRRLNAITKKDVYPLPRIDDALDTLQGCNYFSSIDLRSGYWQVPLRSGDKEKTAFITPDGLFQFTVMPFGLCNAPATFERMMDTVLKGLKWYICLCYLDDIVIFSSTFAEHLSRLEKVLVALQMARLTMNIKKCRFAASQIDVLGHVVDSNGIRPDPKKTRRSKRLWDTING